MCERLGEFTCTGKLASPVEAHKVTNPSTSTRRQTDPNRVHRRRENYYTGSYLRNGTSYSKVLALRYTRLGSFRAEILGEVLLMWHWMYFVNH